jgi:putative flippase GtrA
METASDVAAESAAGAGPGPVATVDVVVPVHDEEDDLEPSVRRLHAYLDERFPLSWTITIADNASTDGTWAIAGRLAAELPGVRALHLDQKGRGRALRTAWAASPSPVVGYMDVDLSTDLDALLPLVAPLVSGHSDVAIGSRLAANARVVRGAKREVISRTYNLLLRTSLRTGFSDAQCGFKALRSDVARALLPQVEDQGWFFDTELLVLAERNGLRIHEVPVDWVDDPDSRVDVVATARADLRGVVRMLWPPTAVPTPRPPAPLRVAPSSPPAPGAGAGGGGAGPIVRLTLVPRAPAPASLADQLARFVSVGVVSTVVFGLLLAVLHGPLGWVAATVVALAVCSLANTTANRRLTFARRGSHRRGRQLRDGLVLSGLPLVTTLAAVAATTGTADAARVVVVTLASGLSALVRFVLLRRWVFR